MSSNVHGNLAYMCVCVFVFIYIHMLDAGREARALINNARMMEEGPRCYTSDDCTDYIGCNGGIVRAVCVGGFCVCPPQTKAATNSDFILN